MKLQSLEKPTVLKGIIEFNCETNCCSKKKKCCKKYKTKGKPCKSCPKF